MQHRTRPNGFTLLEAMFLMVIIGIVGVGAGIGLQAVAKTPTQTDLQLAINSEMVDRMEQMKATAFASLSTEATALSGAITINGKSYTSTVTVAAADADADGSNDSDYKQITVTIGSQSLTTFVIQP